jgi:hypothetical protein
VDRKLFFTDPDPTLQLVPDPDLNFQKFRTWIRIRPYDFKDPIMAFQNIILKENLNLVY